MSLRVRRFMEKTGLRQVRPRLAHGHQRCAEFLLDELLPFGGLNLLPILVTDVKAVDGRAFLGEDFRHGNVEVGIRSALAK